MKMSKYTEETNFTVKTCNLVSSVNILLCLLYYIRSHLFIHQLVFKYMEVYKEPITLNTMIRILRNYDMEIHVLLHYCTKQQVS